MIHILYLAAGSGRRFGSNKLLYPLGGRPLFSHGLDTLSAVAGERGDCTLTVVSRYPEILEAARSMGALAVDSPHSERGLSHTIRAGLTSLPTPAPSDFLLFMAADQPWVKETTVSCLLDAARTGLWAACAGFGKERGNPVLFSAALLPDLLALRGDEGGRSILRRHPERVVLVPVTEERELWDIDRLSDVTERGNPYE